jgi:glycosyltransferase involved in cell wall biosynthesis
MKIAFVYDAVYPYRIGGVEKRICELSKRLAQRGHEVHIFGLKEWVGDASFVRNGVFYHGVGQSRPFYSNGRRSAVEALYFGWKVQEPLLKQHFDIIDCQNFPYFSCLSAAFAAKMRHSPLVITWHEVWNDYWYEYLGISGFTGKAIEKLTSRLSDNLVAVSDLTKKDVMSMRKDVSISVIPNGIDFSHINAIQPSGIHSDIIFTGRLLKEKNVELLIRAVAIIRKELPDVRCIIAGDGPARDSLQNLVNECNLAENITFTGFLKNHDELIALMKSSLVCASPSTREGFGIAALEAMACGLPVVTVDAPKNAVLELVNEKTGRVSSLVPKDFAELIIECLNKRKLMTESCIVSAKDCNWEKIVDKTEDYYSKVMDQ